MVAHVAELRIRNDEPAAEGHFPGNPIVPGAVLLREVLRIVTANSDAQSSEIRAARFFQPVRPGDCLTVRWDISAAGDRSFTCMTALDDRRVLSGTLRMSAR